MLKEVQAKVPYYSHARFGISLMDLLVSALMIIGAVGLIRTAAWGRLLTIIYGFSSILLKVIGVTWALCVVWPAMLGIIEHIPKQGPNDSIMLGTQAASAIAVPLCMGMLVWYPALVLAWMFVPSVAATFRGVGAKRRLRRALGALRGVVFRPGDFVCGDLSSPG